MTHVSCLLKIASIGFYFIQGVYNYLHPLNSSYTKHHLISFAHFIGCLLSHASGYIFTLLLIFIAQGYTLTYVTNHQAHQQDKGIFLELSLPLGLFLGLVKLVSLGYAISETLGNSSIYSGTFGMFLIAVKVCQWLFFEWSLYETSRSEFLSSGTAVTIRGKGSREDKLSKFLKALGIFGTCFILGFVLLLFFGNYLVPHIWEHTFLEITRLLFEGLTLIAMASLLTKKTGIYRDVSLMFRSELGDVFE